MLTTEPNAAAHDPTQAVIDAALELPEQARFRVMIELIESLDADQDCPPDEHQRLWSEEIQRRLADYDAGREEAIPFDTVMAELGARYRS